MILEITNPDLRCQRQVSGLRSFIADTHIAFFGEAREPRLLRDFGADHDAAGTGIKLQAFIVSIQFYDETVAKDMLGISSHGLEFSVSLLDFAYQLASVHRLIDSRFQERKIVLQ